MSRLFRSGVVIGKFCPPHRGHSFLIDAALRQAERVTVIVCARDGQSIAGERRAAWLRELHPHVTVMVIEDVYPPDDSALWARKTLEWLGFVPDAVFTSEEYGPRYAAELGAVHVAVDPGRKTIPCSASAIRADPLSNWDFLEPCVRAHYAFRVAVVGAESTGTTTLAQDLAENYVTAWVPEYGREYSEQFKFREGATWRTEDFVDIAREQCRREDELAQACQGVLVCDTDALATAIWHERYMGFPSPEVNEIARSRSCHLYLVTDVSIPFVQDGFRDGEHLRGWMQERLIEELERLNRPFAIVSGPPQERLAASVKLIDELLTSRIAAPRVSDDGFA